MFTRFLLILGLAGMAASCATAPQNLTPPVLDRVEVRERVERYDALYPTFHFHADGGDVVEVHREILSSDTTHPNFNPVSRINIDPEQQKTGAVWVGGWSCGPNASTTVVRAWLVDRRGNRSNAVDYRVVCKSAAELFGDDQRRKPQP